MNTKEDMMMENGIVQYDQMIKSLKEYYKHLTNMNHKINVLNKY